MSEAEASKSETVGKKPPLKERLKALFDEYGRIAIILYLALSLLTTIGFCVAMWIGVEPTSDSGVIGVLFAGWLAAKATMPLRILATLALTPAVAALVRRKHRKKPPVDEAA